MAEGRDQSEDRPAPKFAVVYIDGEQSPRWADQPWKVFDLRINPGMRGISGRISFFTAKDAVAFALACERNPSPHPFF